MTEQAPDRFLPVAPRKPPQQPRRELEAPPPPSTRKGMLTRIGLLLGALLIVGVAGLVLGGKWLTNYFAATGDTTMLRVMLSLSPRWANERIATSHGGTLEATPLASAFLNGNTEAVELLLARGADPNLDWNLTYKCMDAAIARGDVAALEAFAAAGGKPTAEALQFALGLKDGGALLRAMARPGMAKGDPTAQRELLLFIDHGFLQPEMPMEAALPLVIEAGFEPGSSDGDYLAFTSLRYGRSKLAGLLIEAGACPFEVDYFRESTLREQLGAQRWSALFDPPADLEQRCSRTGRTPLLSTVALRSNAAAMELIARGVDVRANVPMDFTVDAGLTALHFAARGGDKQLVVALLAAGADPLARDAAGETPADLATNAAIRKLLEGTAAGRKGANSP